MSVNELVARFRREMNLPAARVAAPAKALTMREQMQLALDTDDAHRYRGVTGDLFTIDQIKWEQDCDDGSVPVLRRFGRTRAAMQISTASDFTKKFTCGVPALAEFPLMTAGKGLVVAGGACCNLLTGAFTGDVDLFLVGMSETEATDKIHALAKHLHAYDLETKYEMHAYRTERCVTFTVGRLPIQVVLRRYNTISEVIHGFDLGSPAVAYDGQNVFFTSLGKFAYEYDANVLCLTRRRKSYEHRLVKYFDRGFGLVLPDLSIEVLEKTKGSYWWADMPHFYLRRIDKCQNHIACDLMVSHKIWTMPTPVTTTAVVDAETKEKEVDDPFATSDYGSINYRNHHKLMLNNFISVCQTPVNTGGLCAMAKWGASGDVRTLSVTLDSDRLEGEIMSALQSSKVDTDKLKKLVGVAIATDLIAGKLRGDKTDIKELAKGLVDVVSARAKLPFKYQQIDDETSIVGGAFRMSTMKKADWYGEFYKAT